jgi:hypothetical protein
MRLVPAVALLIIGIALPVCAHGASHGGSHGGFGGGSRGGFSARSASGSAAVSRSSNGGGFRASAPGRSAGIPNYTNRYASNMRRSFAPGGGAGRVANARASYGTRTYGNQAYRPDNRRHPYRSPYRTGFGIAPWIGSGIGPGWIGSDYVGYPDDDSDNGYAEGSYDPNYGAAPYDAANDDGAPGYPGQGYQDQPPIPYQTPRQNFQTASAPLTMEAVTLVFKDGRPAEHIHNYILTRTTLSILDQHHRDIPIDELDLAATQKANRDSGVDFQLPG